MTGLPPTAILVERSLQWTQADFHCSMAMPISTSGKMMENSIHRALICNESQSPSCSDGTFKNSTDQLHRMIVIKQL